MTDLLETVMQFQEHGGEFILKGKRIQVSFPPECRKAVAPFLNKLRANREALENLIRNQSWRLAPVECPALPHGVRLVSYAPKAPPVAVAPVSIVTDVDKFVRVYLGDLGHRLQHPEARACAPLADILAKLAEVGVELALERS